MGWDSSCLLFSWISTIITWDGSYYYSPCSRWGRGDVETSKHLNTVTKSVREDIQYPAVIGAVTSHFGSQAGMRACLFEDTYEGDGDMQRFISETSVPFSLHVRCSESGLSVKRPSQLEHVWGLCGCELLGRCKESGVQREILPFCFSLPPSWGLRGVLITHCWQFGSG